ncbi:hypothetical protein BJV78DRAFT_1280268 [Lactifluus subvellereus]|nr:hypothetical protein BJV78DRAFT_1280268 [Lactifluus subvellereus]
MASARRLRCIQRALAPLSQVIGTLTLGDISYPVPTSATPSRLPHITPLDPNGPCTCEHLYFLLQKFVLDQTCSSSSSQVPMRRLALTFCSVVNAEHEYTALHRDVRETELKQAREIREGVDLVHFRETPMMAHTSSTLFPPADAVDARFIPAHPSFRILAIGAPVPPCTGYSLDPPFRSRFQVRFLDPTSILLAYPDSPRVLLEVSAALWTILRDLVDPLLCRLF